MSSVIAELKTKISLSVYGSQVELPCVHSDGTGVLKFTWTLPAGLEQSSYIFEMKTQKPTLYSDGKTYKCAYYATNRIDSKICEHKLIGTDNEALNYNTWIGACEIRLTVFDDKKNIYCTHEYFNGTYNFETQPQYKRWDSRNENYYFYLTDNLSDSFFFSEEQQVYKYELNLNLGYDSEQVDLIEKTIQFSDSILFGEGLSENFVLIQDNLLSQDSKYEIDFKQKTEENSNNSNKVVLDFNQIYYCRIRNFDGYDYSDWSKTFIFQVNYIEKLHPQILGLQYPKQSVYIKKQDSAGNINYQKPVENASDPYNHWSLDYEGQNGNYKFMDEEKITENAPYYLDQKERAYGEVIIKLRVESTTDTFVSGELGYYIGDNFENRAYQDFYNENELHSLRLVQPLLRIPTNKDIEITWQTIFSNNKQLKSLNKINILFFNVVPLFNSSEDQDIYSQFNGITPPMYVTSFKNFYINNVSDAESIPNDLPRWWTRGQSKKPPINMLLLSREFNKDIIYANGIQIEKSSSEETKDLDFDWVDYWNKYENGQIKYRKIVYDENPKKEDEEGKKGFIFDDPHLKVEEVSSIASPLYQKVTSDKNYNITYYKKYLTTTEEYPWSKYVTSMKKQAQDMRTIRTIIFNNNDDEYNYENAFIYDNSFKAEGQDELQRKYQYYILKSESRIIPTKAMNIQDKVNHIEKEIVTHKESNTNNNSKKIKHITFCPECEELFLLQCVYEYNGKIIDNPTQRWGLMKDDYKLSVVKLKFICPNCGKVYPQQLIYQNDYQFDVNQPLVRFPFNLFYYYGYNFPENYEKAEWFKNNLLLKLEDEFKEEESSKGEVSEQEKPAKKEQFIKLVQFEAKSDHESEKKVNPSKYVYGLYPEDILLSKPFFQDVSPYFNIHPPMFENKTSFGIYDDGVPIESRLQPEGSAKKEYYNDQNQQVDWVVYFDKDEVWSRQKSLHSKYLPPLAINYNSYSQGFAEFKNDGGKNIFLLAQKYDDSYYLQTIDANHLDSNKNYSPSEKFIYEYQSSSSPNDDDQFDDDEYWYDEDYWWERQQQEIESNNEKANQMESYNALKIYNLFHRDQIVFNVNFPIVIEKGVNDHYSYCLNDKQVFEGSLLEEGQLNLVIQSDNTQFKNIVEKLLSSFFDINQIYDKEKEFGEKPKPKIRHFTYSSEYKNSYKYYSIPDKLLKSFQFLECENSCYDIFNFNNLYFQQNFIEYFDINNKEQGVSNNTSQSLVYNPTSNQTQKIMYYTLQDKFSAQLFDVSESKIDNSLDFNSNVSNGQPIFTCFPDEVDKDGHHFKFTEQDFQKTKQIYVRTYEVVNCNPIPKEGFGYRDWIVVPIPGKPNRYYKKQVLNTRGTVATSKEINVLVNDQMITELGYFNGKTCLSHAKPKKIDPKYNVEYYERIENKWRSVFAQRQCAVYKYVPFERAWTKNFVDLCSGNNPFNRKTPINIKALSSEQRGKLLRKYGFYVMGDYDLTEEQKELWEKGQNNRELWYSKTFTSSSSVEIDGKKETILINFDEKVYNNWTPLLISTPFVAEAPTSAQNSSFTVNVLKQKKGKLVMQEKSINALIKFEKSWKKYVKQPSNSDTKDFWKDTIYDTSKPPLLAQTTVEQLSVRPKAEIDIYTKWGYEQTGKKKSSFTIHPDIVKEEPFKKLVNLSTAGNQVHYIQHDDLLNMKLLGRINKERYLISDKSFMAQREDYTRAPYLDYRLQGKSTGEKFPYFSGLPRSEFYEAYKTRPEPVYPYDRPLRIGGLNKTMFVESAEQLNGFEFNYQTNKYQNPKGAYIYKPTQTVLNPGFIFLQDTWNTVNLLHWSMDVSPNMKFYLYAVEWNNETNTQKGEQFSVKTKTSVWDSKYSLNNSQEKGAWAIPYNENLSDYVDFNQKDKNGNPLFKLNEENGTLYRFYLYSKLGTENGSIVLQSHACRISRTAVSPANILSIDYDPWTKLAAIKFRFDDALEREYDIIRVLWSEDIEGSPGANVWKEYKGDIYGKIYELASNKNSNLLLNENFVKTHTISINIDDIEIEASDSLRLRIEAALSLERQGLTLPTFKFQLWANEILKPIDEQISLLQGFKSATVWQEAKYDETTNEIIEEGKWVYLPPGQEVQVQGSIQFAQESIKQIEDKFSKWYANKALFTHFDVDVVENFLYDTNPEYATFIEKSQDANTAFKIRWKEFYYVFVFNQFLENNDSIKAEYYYEMFPEEDETIIPEEEEITVPERYKNEKWAFSKNYEYLLNGYYNEHRFKLLNKYRNTKQLEKYFEMHRFSEQNYKQVRQEYYQFKKESLENVESDSQADLTDQEIIDFISLNDLGLEFIQFLSKKYQYKDTRFEQRAWYLYKTNNVHTKGLFGNKFEDTIIDTNLSDYYQTQYVIENQVNYGKYEARNFFLNQISEHGTKYKVLYSQLNEQIRQLSSQLQKYKLQKIKINHQFRENLIKQGFYCNGFEDNLPFYQKNINTCFRWRVETNPYDAISQSKNSSQSTFKSRYETYARFQMDFYKSFDSQNGKPLRDITRVNNNASPDGRISAQVSVITSESAKGSITETMAQQQIIYHNGRKLNAELNLEYNLLPGMLETDIIPEDWKEVWIDKWGNRNTICPFKSVYFYRVAIYNLVEAPVFDTYLLPLNSADIKKINDNTFSISINLSSQFSTQNILSSSLSGIYAAWKKTDKPMWRKNICSNAISDEITIYDNYEDQNSNSISDFSLKTVGYIKEFKNDYDEEYGEYENSDNYVIYTGKEMEKHTSSYNSLSYGKFSANLPAYNNTWVNNERAINGEVQFLTDRPRQIIFPEIIQTYFKDSYLVTFPNCEPVTYYKLEETYTYVDFKMYPIYSLNKEENTQKLPVYLYYAADEYEGVLYWHFGNADLLPNIDNSSTDEDENTVKPANSYSNFIISGFPDNDTVIKRELSKGLYSMEMEGYNELAVYKSYAIDDEENAKSLLLYPPEIDYTTWMDLRNYGDSESQPEIIIENTESNQEYHVNYINDNLNNFSEQWIPFSNIRKKPFVIKHNMEYLLFSHKEKTNIYVDGTSYVCSVITLSRGKTSDIFGEQTICFPKYINEELSSVINFSGDSNLQAVSFENPCVIKIQENKWRMYFNVIVLDNDKQQFQVKIYKTDTYNFEDWFDYQEIMIECEEGENIGNCYEPCVNIIKRDINESSSLIEEEFKFELYVSCNGAIYNSYSYDGINFTKLQKTNFIDNLWGGYRITSPCIYDEYELEYKQESDGNNEEIYTHVKKLYVNIFSADKAASLIVSVEWDFATNNWKMIYSQADRGESTYSIIQKSGYPAMEQTIFRGNFISDTTNQSINYFINPCVIKDYDGGSEIRRIYYNTYDYPYLWNDGKLRQFRKSELLQLTIHTEYLEKYLWKKVWQQGNKEPEIILNKEQVYDNQNEAKNISIYAPNEEDINIYAVKVKLNPNSTINQCMAQAPWIGYDNINDTTAIFTPEFTNEDRQEYSALDYVINSNLTDEYNNWLTENIGGNHEQFLRVTKRYPQYLWWAIKGPCIYRYVGYGVLKNYNWQGKNYRP